MYKLPITPAVFGYAAAEEERFPRRTEDSRIERWSIGDISEKGI